MELNLNVYKGKEIEKTYTAETYDLMFGTLEDIINVIDLEKLNSRGKVDDSEFVMSVCGIVTRSFDQIKPLVKDIFPGITDGELRRVKATELARVIIEVLKYSFTQMFSTGNSKNK